MNTIFNEENLLVIDEFLSPASLTALDEIFETSRFNLNSSSSDERKEFYETMGEIDLTSDGLIELEAEISSKVKLISDTQPFLDQALVNYSRFGDYSFRHCDVTGSGYISVLLYGSIIWDRAWGGETIFFASSGDASIAVPPKVNRAVIYPSVTEHIAGVPSIQCPHHRNSLSVRYKTDPSCNSS